jgi:hypothetical protein
MNWSEASLNRRAFTALAGSLATFVACACRRAHAQKAAEPGDPVAGGDMSTKSHVLGMGADALQGKGPINDINMYLNGFHFYADDMGRQIEAHHYCTHVNEDFFQCVIYDGNQSGSRLIGIEYIVSERLFVTLPEEEKSLWHSHRHETTSGELIMPGIPGPVERTAIATLASTYGKTWHTWQIDQNSALPLGIPQLMMGFTQDGQLKPGLLQDRDRRLGVSTTDERRRRAELASFAPPVRPGADGWTGGQSHQLKLDSIPLKNKRE